VLNFHEKVIFVQNATVRSHLRRYHSCSNYPRGILAVTFNACSSTWTKDKSEKKTRVAFSYMAELASYLEHLQHHSTRLRLHPQTTKMMSKNNGRLSIMLKLLKSNSTSLCSIYKWTTITLHSCWPTTHDIECIAKFYRDSWNNFLGIAKPSLSSCYTQLLSKLKYECCWRCWDTAELR
jgi:hypothetical protein